MKDFTVEQGMKWMRLLDLMKEGMLSHIEHEDLNPSALPQLIRNIQSIGEMKELFLNITATTKEYNELLDKVRKKGIH